MLEKMVDVEEAPKPMEVDVKVKVENANAGVNAVAKSGEVAEENAPNDKKVKVEPKNDVEMEEVKPKVRYFNYQLNFQRKTENFKLTLLFLGGQCFSFS